MKKDTALKIIFVSLAALLVLWLAKAILFPTGYGMGIYINGNMAGGYEHMQRGYGYAYSNGGSLGFFIAALIKILFGVLIIGLIVGAIQYIKNNLFTEDDKSAIRASFAGKKPEPKKLCSECGKEINPSWKVCPHCGKAVTTNTTE